MSEHLEELRRQYPGQLVLTPDQIAKVLGSARQTIYNQVSKKEFPIRPICRGRTWGCSIIDIARYLDTGVSQIQAAAVKSKPGRKPSPRSILKFQTQITWDGYAGDDNATSGRKPSTKQLLKYQGFWSDVLERMRQTGQAEEKIHVVRAIEAKEI